jgi:ABC-2 type transport system permease protein
MTGIAAVFYRDYRQRMTNVGFVFWDLLAPIAYLLLFGLGFERMIGAGFVVEGKELGYTAFLLPGVLAMVSFTVAMNASWGFFMDKDSGIFDELLTYPITRPQLLIGKISFNVVVSLIGSALVIALGAAVSELRLRVELLALTAAVVTVSTAGWFFLFSIFAIRLRRMDAFNTVTSAAYILLMFISTMFYPLTDMPAWFRWVAYFNPLTWQVDLLRYGLLGLGTPSVLVVEGVALCIFSIVCLAFAVRTLGRAS